MDLVLLPLLTMLAAGVAFGENPQELDLTSGKTFASVNVTVRDGPVRGAVHDTVGHCQHGKPCAIACPSDKDEGASLWPGLEDELWWGEEWKDVQIKGESPTMISPGVLIADRLRNPSLAGCRKRYRVTIEGSDATGIPAGSVLEGPAKKVRMEIARPYPRLVRPTCKHLSRSMVIPVVVGQRTEIQCEGFGGACSTAVLADEPVSRGGRV
ncbi:hypothetical protein Q5P01_000157 [Channa striata]|uniref:Secreted protein n=1 Tax=Channa striata TaxID=64152 RepID=A0AA88IGN5_CHASR|nr:hypothetical protein Q5P01_000157 [Channa striata]